jgi:hypothetical protein
MATSIDENADLSKKRQVITEIFEGLRAIDKRSDVLTFSNEMVKEVTIKHKFRNPFDATKFNTYESLPESLKQEEFFIVHLGRGNHAFVRGTGFHSFEPIQQSKGWELSNSIVSKLGESEADTVSTIYNEKIVHDFLFNNIATELKIHNSRRSTTDYDFWIGKNQLHADHLQIEMDALFESKDTIATVEVKNIKHTNFEIRQLYSTFRYLDRFYRDGKIPNNYNLRHLFAIASETRYAYYHRVYEYTFTDWKHMDSIALVKNAEYSTAKEGWKISIMH